MGTFGTENVAIEFEKIGTGAGGDVEFQEANSGYSTKEQKCYINSRLPLAEF